MRRFATLGAFVLAASALVYAQAARDAKTALPPTQDSEAVLMKIERDGGRPRSAAGTAGPTPSSGAAARGRWAPDKARPSRPLRSDHGLATGDSGPARR